MGALFTNGQHYLVSVDEFEQWAKNVRPYASIIVDMNVLYFKPIRHDEKLTRKFIQPLERYVEGILELKDVVYITNKDYHCHTLMFEERIPVQLFENIGDVREFLKRLDIISQVCGVTHDKGITFMVI